MSANSEKSLQFSKLLRSRWLTNVQDKELREPTIVVNISNSDAVIASPPPQKVLKPRKSTILQGNAFRAGVPWVPEVISFATQFATVVRGVQPLSHPRLSRSSSRLWNLKANVDWGENVVVSTRVFYKSLSTSVIHLLGVLLNLDISLTFLGFADLYMFSLFKKL